MILNGDLRLFHLTFNFLYFIHCVTQIRHFVLFIFIYLFSYLPNTLFKIREIYNDLKHQINMILLNPFKNVAKLKYWLYYFFFFFFFFVRKHVSGGESH